MRSVDSAILGIDYGAIELLDGFVEVDTTGKVVQRPTPYGVYFASLGDDHSARLVGRPTRRAKFFSITYVGTTRDQAMLAGEKFRDQLSGRRLAIEGHKAWLIEVEESQRIRRDDELTSPDGSPLFYGVDNYAVSLTKSLAPTV